MQNYHNLTANINSRSLHCENNKFKNKNSKKNMFERIRSSYSTKINNVLSVL